MNCALTHATSSAKSSLDFRKRTFFLVRLLAAVDLYVETKHIDHGRGLFIDRRWHVARLIFEDALQPCTFPKCREVVAFLHEEAQGVARR